MSYLTRLKWLDGAKIFTYPPETVPPKLTQPGSVSFGGSIPAHIEKITLQMMTKEMTRKARRPQRKRLTT